MTTIHTTIQTHLSDITTRNLTVQYSFTFVAEILTQGSDLDIGIFDADFFIYQYPIK